MFILKQDNTNGLQQKWDRILFKRLKSLVLNPVFRWVCFAVFSCAVMFDEWAQTLEQSVKSDITVRSEVQNLQVYKLKAGFSYFLILILFYIYPLVHFLLSLHFTPSLQSAFYTDRDKTTLCTFWSFVRNLYRILRALKEVWQYLSIMKICYSWWQRSFCQS